MRGGRDKYRFVFGRLRCDDSAHDQSPRRNPVLKIEIQLMTTTNTHPMSPVKKAPSRKRMTQTAKDWCITERLDVSRDGQQLATIFSYRLKFFAANCLPLAAFFDRQLRRGVAIEIHGRVWMCAKDRCRGRG